jgi:hypothetical protein
MPVLNSIAASVTANTHYLKADGTLTTTETDRNTWIPRTAQGSPVRLQGAATGGTSVVTVQFGIGPKSNPGLADIDPVQGGNQPGITFAAYDVMSESANLFASLPAGAVADGPGDYYRVKWVQSGASATASFLSAAG